MKDFHSNTSPYLSLDRLIICISPRPLLLGKEKNKLNYCLVCKEGIKKIMCITDEIKGESLVGFLIVCKTAFLLFSVLSGSLFPSWSSPSIETESFQYSLLKNSLKKETFLYQHICITKWISVHLCRAYWRMIVCEIPDTNIKRSVHTGG